MFLILFMYFVYLMLGFFFYILKPVPIYFSGSGKYSNTVLPKVTFHRHAALRHSLEKECETSLISQRREELFDVGFLYSLVFKYLHTEMTSLAYELKCVCKQVHIHSRGSIQNAELTPTEV